MNSGAASLKMGVLGVGYLGNFHAQKIKAHSRAQLVGVHDPRREQGEKIAQSLKVDFFADAGDLLKVCDAVTIASTTLTHFEMAKMALEAGVHVNVEKPMTATSAQSRELMAIARKNRLLLTVGHIERFNPAVTWLKNLILEKKVLPQFLEFHRMAPFRLRGSDVSVLQDLMIHDLDLIHHLTDSAISQSSVSGSRIISEELDAAQGFFTTENGVKAFVHVNRCAPRIQRSIEAVFHDEVIMINTQTFEVERAIAGEREASEPQKMTKFQIDKVDALAAETDHFIRAVHGEINVFIPAEAGLTALEQCEKIEAALQGKGS